MEEKKGVKIGSRWGAVLSAVGSAMPITWTWEPALFSTWEEMLGEAPVLLDAVLIPFQGSIISDGLVVPYQIYFGKGAKEGFKDAYMNAKRNNAIRFSI